MLADKRDDPQIGRLFADLIPRRVKTKADLQLFAKWQPAGGIAAGPDKSLATPAVSGEALPVNGHDCGGATQPG